MRNLTPQTQRAIREAREALGKVTDLLGDAVLSTETYAGNRSDRWARSGVGEQYAQFQDHLVVAMADCETALSSLADASTSSPFLPQEAA